MPSVDVPLDKLPRWAQNAYEKRRLENVVNRKKFSMTDEDCAVEALIFVNREFRKRAAVKAEKAKQMYAFVKTDPEWAGKITRFGEVGNG
jgi:hypothetical protein